MEKQRMRIGRQAGILLSLLLAAAFSLIFFYNNTPLGAAVGSDNAMYLTMGTALAKGYAPYTEIFDHKGPLLFLLQMIPQLFGNGYSLNAVFLQEVLFLFVSLRAVNGIAGACGTKYGVIAQLFYLAALGQFSEGGNLAEEYTNLFTLTGIWICLRVFAGEGERISGKKLVPSAAILGVMTMLCLLERANNVLPLGAVVLVLTLSLIRKPGDLGFCALGFTLGCAAAAVPVVLWLMTKGALSASIYGAFVHNLLYSETEGLGRLHMLFADSYGRKAMVLAAVSCCGALVLLRRRKYAMGIAMIAGAAAGGMAAFISHKYYLHYLNLGVPMALAGMCLLLGESEKHGKRAAKSATIAAAVVSVAFCLEGGIAANRTRLEALEGMDEFAQNARELYAEVPESDRGSFMAYRVEPKWYVYTEALPCMRFYFLQEILGQADPAVMDEIAETFRTNPPKWVVLYYNRPFSPPYDERVAEIFEEKYEFIDAKGEYQLLKLKEETGA